MTHPLDFDFDWLQGMIVALEGDAPISDELRSDILHALYCYLAALNIVRPEDYRPRGRPAHKISEDKAQLVCDLVEKYGATVKAAVAVVSPHVSMNDRIARAYRTVKNGPRDWSYHPDTLATYASKLPKKRK